MSNERSRGLKLVHISNVRSISGVKIYFGDIYPVHKVSITTETEITDGTVSVCLIGSSYKALPISLSNFVEVQASSNDVKKYDINCEDQDGIGIKVEKVESSGLWCLVEVAAFVQATDTRLTKVGKYHNYQY